LTGKILFQYPNSNTQGTNNKQSADMKTMNIVDTGGFNTIVTNNILNEFKIVYTHFHYSSAMTNK
jgi:hypothetical protein